MDDLKILQLSHGKIMPDYISAYAMRVNHLLENHVWNICSVSGLIIHDKKSNNISEYRSIITTAYSVVKGNRFLEIAISKGIFLRRKYINAVKALINEADAVIFEGPWQYPLFKKYLKNKFVVYDAHNVETLLRSGNKYYDYTYNIEKEIAQNCYLLISVSEKDLKYFKEEMKCKNALLNTHVLGNHLYEWKGENSKHILFIGSIYKPNIEAVDIIISIAKNLPDFYFDIIGNINTHGFPHAPKNIIFHGLVDESVKNQLFQNSAIALNPVITGGGRNVKMVDYIMHGIPVISTDTGIRGFTNYDLSNSVIVEKPENFKETIIKLIENKELLRSMSDNTFKVAHELIKAEGNRDAYTIIKTEFEKWKNNNNI
ncbi:glycosyltransferase [Ferroplasma sp.]|uniref:glycosyltransferase n=1 Tax=Ferroplasma sp. TaxID=2591003 RepID=UPI00307EBBDD